MANIVKRMFQMTDFENNNNKFWQIEYDSESYDCTVTTTFGRVGKSSQVKTKQMTQRSIRALVQEKIDKGYKEVILHKVTPVVVDPTAIVSATPQPPAVVELVKSIFIEAGEKIDSYLATSVDALSQEQIARGRKQLEEVVAWYGRVTKDPSFNNKVALYRAVTTYYTTIPTQLPHNLRDQSVMDGIVTRIATNPHEQEERLDQLETAIATYQGPTVAGKDYYSQLGSSLLYLPGSDKVCGEIEQFLSLTSKHGYSMRLKNVFEVTIPSERAAYEANSRGKELILRLTHGTNGANMKHILHEKGAGSGLRLPRSAANGWMFGPGIYFANIASKSAQYVSNRNGHPKMMLLADVAVGKMYESASPLNSVREAPNGYDSVRGVAGKTGSWGGRLAYDEYIVYTQPQQTIRYLITWE